MENQVGEIDAVSTAQIDMQAALRALQDYERIADLARQRAGRVANELRIEMNMLVESMSNDITPELLRLVQDYVNSKGITPAAPSASLRVNAARARF